MQKQECLDRTVWTLVCLLPLPPGMLLLVQHKSRDPHNSQQASCEDHRAEYQCSNTWNTETRQTQQPFFLTMLFDPSLHASHRRQLCFLHSHTGINSSGSVFFMAGLQNPLKYWYAYEQQHCAVLWVSLDMPSSSRMLVHLLGVWPQRKLCACSCWWRCQRGPFSQQSSAWLWGGRPQLYSRYWSWSCQSQYSECIAERAFHPPPPHSWQNLWSLCSIPDVKQEEERC